MGRAGRFWVTKSGGENVRWFEPTDLPPDPPLQIGDKEVDLIERANRALGRLDGLTATIPDTHLFLYTYVRKEALLSSQIEGTQSSFSELLLAERSDAPGLPHADVVEVSNYVAAMEHGLDRIREGFPLSLRLIREIHGVLLRQGRGSALTPGEFRTSQNWVGGTRPGTALYVPPQPQLVMPLMGALEKFLHGDPKPTPVLIKAALSHVQFESIHPFLDGNGRLGRLLITFLLCTESALSQPLLYLSLFFKARREEYYALLQRVREDGDWEGWLRFFLQGVLETADQAVETAKRILAMFEEHRASIKAKGRAAGSALRIHDVLTRYPVVAATEAAAESGLSAPTVRTALEVLEGMGLVREATGRQRDRLYLYQPYVDVLSEGTDPIKR